MGIFDFLTKKPAADPQPDPAPREETSQDEEKPVVFKYHFPEKDSNEPTVDILTWVNLTEKNVKVTVPDGDDGLLVKGVYLWEEDGTLRGLQGDKVIFEVTKRSKAYKELEKFFRRKTGYIVLKKKQGEYGDYYKLKLKFHVVKD